MAISQEGITVKNTFIDFDTPTTAKVPRSSSVPRTFKPVSSDAPHSDDSTNASEKDASDHFQTSCSGSDFEDHPDYRSECMDDLIEFSDPCVTCHQCLAPEPPPASAADDKSRVTLDLVSMVSAGAKSRPKLRTQAQPFQSVTTPPAEVSTMVSNAVVALSSGMDIINVQVTNGGMGGTTMIIGESASTNPDASLTFTLVKDALLSSAERSEKTYILGYGVQPFNNLDALSFSANICCLPAAHQDSACWDFYEKGCCPRSGTCRWDHPSKLDTMRVIVMIKKQTWSTWLD